MVVVDADPSQNAWSKWAIGLPSLTSKAAITFALAPYPMFTESRKDQKTKRFSKLVFDLQYLICDIYTSHQKSPAIKIPYSAGTTTPNLSPFITIYYKTCIYN